MYIKILQCRGSASHMMGHYMRYLIAFYDIFVDEFEDYPPDLVCWVDEQGETMSSVPAKIDLTYAKKAVKKAIRDWDGDSTAIKFAPRLTSNIYNPPVKGAIGLPV